MSAPKFTPGPWKVESDIRSNGGETSVMSADGAYCIGDLHDSGGGMSRPWDECVANARLIAAAPDLYAALHTLIERVEHYAPAMAREGDLDDARAALAKARGETP